MKLETCFALLISLFIPGCVSQYGSKSPYGCSGNIEEDACTLTVNCYGTYDDGILETYGQSGYPSFCELKPSAYIDYLNFGFVHVILKNVNRDIFFQDSNIFPEVTTTLTLAHYDYTDFKLTTMPNLRSLNVSSNSLTIAKFYNQYRLESLTEIDFSHNTISTIEIDKDKYVFNKLKKINLSHNYFVTLDDGIFESFPDLQELDVSYNFIDSVSFLTFEGVKKLQHLNMKHNRLTNINLSLMRFAQLTTLDLSDNMIQAIKEADFEKLQSLEILDLSSNLITKIEPHAFSKTNQLKTLNLHNNILEIISKETFTDLLNLIDVNLSKNVLKNVPKGWFKGKTLSQFSVGQNKLEGVLEKGMFEGLMLVKDLDLSNQHITSLEDLAFYGLDNLIDLLLNNNNINVISKHAFNILQKLEILDLSNNEITCIDFVKKDLISLQSLLLKNNRLFQIKHEYFDGLTSLQYLDLSYNNVTNFEDNSFKSLRDLQNFQISGNPITGTLDKFTFDGLVSLPSLDISHTLINSISNKSFSSMHQLRDLNVSHAKISELQFNAFAQTGLIETIDLSYNQLRDFNVNVTELTNLLTLILNDNFLKVITSTNFKGLPRLSKIVISYNNIDSIVDDAFADQSDLRYLDFSYNTNMKFKISILDNLQNLNDLVLSGIQSDITFSAVKNIKLPRLEMTNSNITNITKLALKHINSLEKLALNNNNITKITTSSLDGVKQLTALDLSFNKLNYIQPGSFKDSTLLRSLNLSHNFLKVLSYGTFRGLLYLDTIDISHNEISDLRNERFYEVQSLTTLIADSNKITSLNVDDSFGTNLKVLSIGGNPIPCEFFVNLKNNNLKFVITAVSLEEKSDLENVDGITCNVDHSYKYTKEVERSFLNEGVLTDIKNILHNISQKDTDKPVITVSETNYSNYFSEVANKMDTVKTEIESSHINVSKDMQKMISLVSEETIYTKETNTLLEKIFKLLNVKTDTHREDVVISTPTQNMTIESLRPYINSKIKQDVENTVAVAKENVLSDLNKKIKEMIVDEIKNSHFNVTKGGSAELISPSHQAFSGSQPTDSGSLIFIEICLGFILVLMLIFILYKFYNSGMFIPSRHSTSTRQLSDALENSTL